MSISSLKKINFEEASFPAYPELYMDPYAIQKDCCATLPYQEIEKVK